MKKIVKRIVPFFDLVLSPIVFVCAILMLLVRRMGVIRMPISRFIFRKVGIFPVRDHYYEPLINPQRLTMSLRQDRALPGIDFNVDEQVALLKQFNYYDELAAIPLDKTDKMEYYFNNPQFVAGDSEYLYSMIRYFKPQKIIEIGCGYSTLMAIKAINQNKLQDPAYQCDQVCIEPYENKWLDDLNVKVERKPVEHLQTNFFQSLNRNDILFIDSSHIIRPQGDVLFEYLSVLPSLNSGVLVHVHDIFTPKDYLDSWIMKEHRFWNEQYLLEAFLTNNHEFKIIGALNFLQHRYPEIIAQKFPNLKEQLSTGEPGSFWMIKR